MFKKAIKAKFQLYYSFYQDLDNKYILLLRSKRKKK